MFRFRPFGLIVFLLFLVTACTKIDTTRLGSGLIPAVDKVNTFDTLLDISTNNFLFEDSTRLSKSQSHAVGNLTDPLFGNTRASMYFELKPSAFPISFFPKDSLLGLDSVVVTLSYAGAYGDTLLPVDLRVFRVSQKMLADTASDYPANYKLNESFATTGGPIGTKSYSSISRIKDSIKIKYRDSAVYTTANKVRIKIDATQFSKIFTSDSTFLQTDSMFRNEFKGFKVEANVLGNPGALLYFNLADTATKLEFFYRKFNGSGGKDTTVGTFYCGATSAHANNIIRDRASSQLQNHLTNTAAGDSLLYIYTTPGTYARLKIKGLEKVPNMIVHRAEIKATQILDNSFTDLRLAVPSFLYLDRFDTAADRIKFKPIPFDLNPAASYTTCFPASEGVDYNYFGGYPVTRISNGQTAYEYTFNLSRYVQSIVTRHAPVSELRLSSTMFAEYFDCYGVQYIPVTGNRVAEGRVRLGGGTHSKYKLQLRIIYSKL